ncbi:unnamed protein product [Calicophoron daubneyi]|uniref:THO complex subunit 7 n=1 Tax=Calicophoron daubneyi TaxID=300641 RepID=A0AAV2T938_CALDB
MSGVSDDEVIKRKLLIEGESGNDDRRITLLLKNYLRWIASDDTGESGHEAYQALVGSVYQCENAMEQSNLVLTMNEEQLEQYSELHKEIEESMEAAKTRIEQCKEDLKSAKIVRKNRREYDGLARIIAEQPERNETFIKYTKLKNRLEKLKKLNEEYDRKIVLRKKQFHLFLFALKGLQKIVDDDESPSEPGSSPAVASQSEQPVKMDVG